LPAATAGAAGNPTLEGAWHGTLGQGEVKLRLALTVSRAADGGLGGVLDSLDQGASLPINGFKVEGESVRFEIAQVGGRYQGSLAPAGNEIRGTWTQSGIEQPLVWVRGPAEGASPPSAAKGGRPLDAPLDVTVSVTPAPFAADGRSHLAYELHVTNASRREVTLRAIEIAGDQGRALARLEGTDLAAQITRLGLADASGLGQLALGPGLRAIVYLWIDLPDQTPPPRALHHRFSITLAGDPEDLTVELGAVAVARGEPIVLAPPLRGGDWVAGNGPSNRSHHRRALLPIGGRARIAQRYAIDWVRAGDDGKTFTGDRKSNRSYHAYGAEALAVASGVVTEVKDGIVENTPGAGRAVPITLETVAGNHVVIDLGNGRFAMYAHLQPASLRVRVGQRVKIGQVIGLVGNSGNSTEPHLHLHISDGGSPLGAEGVPYVFDTFEVRREDETAFRKAARQLPTENEVVRFR
jgi:hypothetical protein